MIRFLEDRIPQPVLLVLSKVYGGVTRLRNYFYDIGVFKSYSIALPVVCVGNMTAGGNAKTPMVRHLATLLQERGLQPVIVTRGYGGRERGPHLVTATDTVERVGDEAVMLVGHTGVPVVIARDRVAGAQFILDQELGNVIILDDGFQHRRLARNIDIVLVNVATEAAIQSFMEGKLLPVGRFREDRSAALKRAQMLIFVDRKVASEPTTLSDSVFASLPEELQLFRAFLKSDGIFSVSASVEMAVGAKVAVLTGIANPEGFLSSVKTLGHSVEKEFLFPDHHQFTAEDIRHVCESCPQLPIVCTEKDLVKLKQLSLNNLFVLKTRIEVFPSDAFAVQIMKGLRNSRQAYT